MRQNYKLSERELRHAWPKMTPEIRDKIIKRNLAIIDDPKSNARAIGIATKNLIAINKQNIDLEPTAPVEQKLKIEIVEDDGSKG